MTTQHSRAMRIFEFVRISKLHQLCSIALDNVKAIKSIIHDNGAISVVEETEAKTVIATAMLEVTTAARARSLQDVMELCRLTCDLAEIQNSIALRGIEYGAASAYLVSCKLSESKRDAVVTVSLADIKHRASYLLAPPVLELMFDTFLAVTGVSSIMKLSLIHI